MRPPKLCPGDCIGIFSPSSPATATAAPRYERAKAYLQSKNFRIVEGSLCGKQDFYRSGSIQARAEELNQLLRDPQIKCIMSSIGGMNSNALLPYIDYEAFRQNPKIVIGYSDVTAILLALYAKTGITTYYGPAAVASFGEYPPFVDTTYESFHKLLCADINLPYTYDKPEFWTEEFIDWNTQDRSKQKNENQWLSLSSGKTTGRLIGGNLNTMQGIWGSPYMPAIEKGDILLIEDSLKDIATVERSFAFLKINGIFDQIGGLILGKHELFKDLGTGRKPYEVLMEVMGEPQFPILADFDSCHTHPMLTLPIGAKVCLDSDHKTLTLLNF